MHYARLTLILLLASCSTGANTVTQTGTLDTGTLRVSATAGKIEAYPPAAGDPKNRYTISSQSATPAVVSHSPGQVTLIGSSELLIRVPDGVRAQLQINKGDIHVTDVRGPVDAKDAQGDIKIQIPSYANASTVRGNISVLFGDANWPGDLHFSAMQGDVELWVPATANARVDLQTDHGIIFTDFDLHGKAHGDVETIVGKIGTGGPRGIIVRVKTGNIRLLRLVPQM